MSRKPAHKRENIKGKYIYTCIVQNEWNKLTFYPCNNILSESYEDFRIKTAKKVIKIFRDITRNVEENEIVHEIFCIVSRFPRYISC